MTLGVLQWPSCDPGWVGLCTWEASWRTEGASLCTVKYRKVLQEERETAPSPCCAVAEALPCCRRHFAHPGLLLLKLVPTTLHSTSHPATSSSQTQAPCGILQKAILSPTPRWECPNPFCLLHAPPALPCQVRDSSQNLVPC